MSTKTQTEHLTAANPAHLTRAAQILREGGTVAFPTETVYGLGANALNPAAVEKIFAAKRRPHWDPLIVHIADELMLAQITQPLSKTARQLTEKFWPGPLTLLLPRTPAIPDIVTAGRPLAGVRIPAHPVALALIQKAGVPIAAPSANTFGHTSPTTAAHVLADLDGRIDAILDGGPTTLGLESTVAEVDSQGVIIYRPGAANLESDFSIDPPMDLGWVRHFIPERPNETPASLPSPGVGIRHYAPKAELILTEIPAKLRTPLEQSLVEAIDHRTTATSRIGVLLPDAWNPSTADLIYPWGPWHAPEILAQRLYAGLRQLDDQGATLILAPLPTAPGISEAIRDRLTKAAKRIEPII